MGGFSPLQWGSDPTQPQPAPDPTQQAPVTSTMGSFPSGAAPATFTSPPPAGTADLENQIGPAQQNLGNALQNQHAQPQGQPGQQPGQQGQFQDPLGPMISDLVARHQQLMQQTQAPSTGSPVKNMLRNFFTGAGNAMMVDAGLPSPNMQRLQLEQQITSLSNARSLYMDRQAEAASRQMQLQMMSTPLTMEQAHAIGHPELVNQVVPPALLPVISSQDRGAQAAQINAQQRQDALDQNTPTIQMPLDANTAKLLSIPNQFVGKNLSAADWRLIDSRSAALGYQKFDTGQDGQGPGRGIWMVDRSGQPVHQMSTISESKRALQAMAPPKPLADATKPVIGFDTDGNQVLTSGTNAQQLGLSEIRDVGQAEAEKVTNARSLLSVFNNPNPNDRGAIQLAQDLARQGKLGPLAGRFQDFLAGTYGAGDPEVEELRTKMGLLATGLMQVHVGARGSAAMMEHFADLASAKKMDGPTLLSGLNAENNYVTRKAMIPKNSRFNTGLANTGTGNTQGGGGFNFGAFPVAQPPAHP